MDSAITRLAVAKGVMVATEGMREAIKRKRVATPPKTKTPVSDDETAADALAHIARDNR